MKIKYMLAVLPILIILVLAVFINVVIKDARRIEEEQRRIIKNFVLSFTGVVVEKESIGHSSALTKISVLSSNFGSYSGEIWSGPVILENDTVIMKLIYDHCLRIGDTVIVGPHDNLIIKNNGEVFYNHKERIDMCNELGREYVNTFPW